MGTSGISEGTLGDIWAVLGDIRVHLVAYVGASEAHLGHLEVPGDIKDTCGTYGDTCRHTQGHLGHACDTLGMLADIWGLLETLEHTWDTLGLLRGIWGLLAHGTWTPGTCPGTFWDMLGSPDDICRHVKAPEGVLGHVEFAEGH